MMTWGELKQFAEENDIHDETEVWLFRSDAPGVGIQAFVSEEDKTHGLDRMYIGE